MKLSFAYGIPERELKQRLTSRDTTKLLAAERCGLIPDPWMQTGSIIAASLNCQLAKQQRPFEPSDFFPKHSTPEKNTDELLIQGFEQRRQQSGNGV